MNIEVNKFLIKAKLNAQTITNANVIDRHIFLYNVVIVQ